MTATAYQLPHIDAVDAEERDELEALTGFVLTDSTSDAQLDAIASSICRMLSHLNADLARYQEAEQAEVRRINLFYNARTEKLNARIEELLGYGAELARRATFPGKSKSRSVAFGSYGRRKSQERVSIVDLEKAIVSIAKLNPSLVRRKPSILVSEVKPAVLYHLKMTGEILDGFSHEPEGETHFIRPEAI